MSAKFKRKNFPVPESSESFYGDKVRPKFSAAESLDCIESHKKFASNFPPSLLSHISRRGETHVTFKKFKFMRVMQKNEETPSLLAFFFALQCKFIICNVPSAAFFAHAVNFAIACSD